MSRQTIRIAAAVAIGLVVVVLIIAGVRSHRTAATAAASAPESAAPAVQTARARFGTFVARVRATGRVGAPAGNEAKLVFAGSGIIAAIDVRVGQRVSAGDALAQLDTRGFALDVASARDDAAAAAASYGRGAVPAAALAGARARLAAAAARLQASRSGAASANSDASAAATALRQSQEKLAADQRALAREQQLFTAGVAAAKDVDAAREQLRLDQADADANRSKVASASAAVGGARTQAQADYQQALTDVRNAEAQTGVTGAQAASAQAKLAQAERALANATLRAPQSGVVTQILKHVGEAVDPTQPVLVVGPPSDGVVTLTVTGGDAARVRAGDAVTVVDQERAARGSGTVSGVVPNVDPATQSTTVTASAVPAGSAPGDAVTATIDVARERGVLIPASAVVTDPQSGKTLVFVQARDKNGEMKFTSREVEIAASDDTTAVLAHGLTNGETIATQGAFDLLAPSGGG